MGHELHSGLVQREAAGDPTTFCLMLMHAEDQLMSAEAFGILAQEFIDLYHRFDTKPIRRYPWLRSHTFMEEKFLPVANKLNTIKGLVAVRDAFFADLSAYARRVTCDDGQLGHLQFDGLHRAVLVGLWPDIDAAQAILSPALSGTITIMSLFVVFLIARNMAEQYGADGVKAGITSLASVLCAVSTSGGQHVYKSVSRRKRHFVAIIVGSYRRGVL